MLPHFVSFATGALLGAALLALLPEAMEGVACRCPQPRGRAASSASACSSCWRSWCCGGTRHEAEEARPRGTIHAACAWPPARLGVLVLVGDSIHNALDGVLIAAAFLTDALPRPRDDLRRGGARDPAPEWATSRVLLHAGMSRQRALVLNLATGLASVIGGVVAYFALRQAMDTLPYALAFAAAGFLYIAVAGLIPGLHRRADPRTSVGQVLLIGLGIGVIAVAERLTHA